MAIFGRYQGPDPYGRPEETREERKLRRKEEDAAGDSTNRFHHSRAYHQYFEGYSEVMHSTGNGKHNRIKREYVGRYFRLNCSDREWVVRKVIYAFLVLAAVCSFVVSQLEPIDSVHEKYIGAVGMLVLLSFAFLMFELVNFLITKRKLTIYEYNNARNLLKTSAVISCVLLVLSAILVFALSEKTSIAVIMGYTISVVAEGILTALIFMEKYEELPNEKEDSHDTVVIQ